MIKIHCVNFLNKNTYILTFKTGFLCVDLSVIELRKTPVSSYQMFGLKVYAKVANKNNFKRIPKLF